MTQTPPRRVELSMPGSVNNGTVRFLTQGSARSGDIYQGYASGLYRQAFLTLGDTALAVRVVSDVIADECALAPARGCGEDDVRHRLAESVFRRCQQLASDTAQRDGRPVPASRGRCRPRSSWRVPERAGAGGARAGAYRRSRACPGQQSAGNLSARHGGPLAHGIAQAGSLIGRRCRNSRGTGEK